MNPSNVIVAAQDDKPVLEIIDFGVAKATFQRLTERTVFTVIATTFPLEGPFSFLPVDSETTDS